MGLSGAANRNIHSSFGFTGDGKVSPQRMPAIFLEPLSRVLRDSGAANWQAVVSAAFQHGTLVSSV
jgi:hypothetical protein